MITIVAGFGRCGSSLVMQMLAAGGMPMTGEYPGFEDDHAAVLLRGGTVSGGWLASVDGCAVKMLDPQSGTIPTGVFAGTQLAYRSIWCKRGYTEQAKSQGKMMSMIAPQLGAEWGSRQMRRRVIASYLKDEPIATRKLEKIGAPPLVVEFEFLLGSPRVEAKRIAAHCGLPDAAWPNMAAQVRERSPACAPGMMELERQLIKERDAR